MSADPDAMHGALRRLMRPDTAKLGRPEDYAVYGRRLAPWAAAFTFVGCWGAIILREGVLLGVAIGWLPAGLIALLAGQLIAWFWGPVALALLIGGLAVLITLAIGKATVRDTTSADAEALNLALDATYPQQAADAEAQRRTRDPQGVRPDPGQASNLDHALP